MSGGEAFVLDEANVFASMCNPEMVDLERVAHVSDEDNLRRLILEHYERTGSANAERILADWHNFLPKFVKVMPRDYKRVLSERLARAEAAAEAESGH